nr:hypothetical protein [uncultured Prevotella sp.]
MAEDNSEIIMLNRPRQKRRGLTLNVDGRITLRSLPCKLLNLKTGDKIAFVEIHSQMYIIKANSINDGIKLHGRKSQLHGSSVSTVRNILSSIVGKPDEAKEIDLIVDNRLASLSIGSDIYEALAVVSRTDASHCR